MLTKILENTPLGRGNRWLKLHVHGNTPLDHEPGTVVGLSLRQAGTILRHAYTVSRVDPEQRTLEFLFRVIPDGRMTPHLAALEPGAPLELTGRGGHPIAEEVDTDPEGIVLVSTGTGIGPVFGYAQRALARGLRIPVRLFAGFRESEDVCLESELTDLAAAYPQFSGHISLSRPDGSWRGLRGRVGDSMPPLLGPVGNLHFHLVGNGAMVVELYEALMLAGLKDERVTSEVYFNFPDHPDKERIRAIAAAFSL